MISPIFRSNLDPSRLVHNVEWHIHGTFPVNQGYCISGNLLAGSQETLGQRAGSWRDWHVQHHPDRGTAASEGGGSACVLQVSVGSCKRGQAWRDMESTLHARGLDLCVCKSLWFVFSLRTVFQADSDEEDEEEDDQESNSSSEAGSDVVGSDCDEDLPSAKAKKSSSKKEKGKKLVEVEENESESEDESSMVGHLKWDESMISKQPGYGVFLSGSSQFIRYYLCCCYI